MRTHQETPTGPIGELCCFIKSRGGRHRSDSRCPQSRQMNHVLGGSVDSARRGIRQAGHSRSYRGSAGKPASSVTSSNRSGWLCSSMAAPCSEPPAGGWNGEGSTPMSTAVPPWEAVRRGRTLRMARRVGWLDHEPPASGCLLSFHHVEADLVGRCYALRERRRPRERDSVICNTGAFAG